MINRILPLLNKVIPAGLAAKGLGKISPGLEKYFTSALASGYTVDTALDYLRNKFQSPGESGYRQRLEQGNAQGTLRPDESASRASLQQSDRLPNLLQKGAAIATGVGVGREASGSTQPPPIPEDNQSQTHGPFKQPPPIPSHEGNQLSSNTVQEQTQGNESVDYIKERLIPITEMDEGLSQFLEQKIKEGQSPQAAAALAKHNQKFSNSMKSFEKSLGMNFVDFINQLFGGNKTPGNKQPSVAKNQNNSSGKQEFLSGLQQLSESLKGMGKKP